MFIAHIASVYAGFRHASQNPPTWQLVAAGLFLCGAAVVCCWLLICAVSATVQCPRCESGNTQVREHGDHSDDWVCLECGHVFVGPMGMCV
jgi:hypothetical protein